MIAHKVAGAELAGQPEPGYPMEHLYGAGPGAQAPYQHPQLHHQQHHQPQQHLQQAPQPQQHYQPHYQQQQQHQHQQQQHHLQHHLHQQHQNQEQQVPQQHQQHLQPHYQQQPQQQQQVYQHHQPPRTPQQQLYKPQEAPAPAGQLMRPQRAANYGPLPVHQPAHQPAPQQRVRARNLGPGGTPAQHFKRSPPHLSTEGAQLYGGPAYQAPPAAGQQYAPEYAPEAVRGPPPAGPHWRPQQQQQFQATVEPAPMLQQQLKPVPPRAGQQSHFASSAGKPSQQPPMPRNHYNTQQPRQVLQPTSSELGAELLGPNEYASQPSATQYYNGGQRACRHLDAAPAPAPHLLGNPTPPLTPNSQNQAGPHLSLVSARAAAPLEQHWPATSQQHALASPTELLQPGYCSPAKPSQPPPPPVAAPVMDSQPQQGWQMNQQPPQQRLQQQQQQPPAHYPATSGAAHQYQPVAAPTSQPAAMAHGAMEQSPLRLTLPLIELEAPLLGPFRLDHDAQYISKVFHLDAQLFERLAKSAALANPNAPGAFQELQLRAYLASGKPPAHHHPHQHQHHESSAGQGESLLACNQPASQQPQRACNWPELFQVHVNQTPLHLERTKGAHRPADIFALCQPGDNMLEIQVNDCYCSHEFVLEAVDRPTLKAFVNSCIKSRLLAPEACLHKLNFNFGKPGFLIASQANEYVALPDGQSRTRVSLRCPISGRRMRRPARGHNCKHLQCFDLENFLSANRERSQWSCPLCQAPIQFNMLELDQHQTNVVQALAEVTNTDEVLLDGLGHWQAYYGHLKPHSFAQSSPSTVTSSSQHQMRQLPAAQPSSMRQAVGWQPDHGQEMAANFGSPVKRPASALSGLQPGPPPAAARRTGSPAHQSKRSPFAPATTQSYPTPGGGPQNGFQSASSTSSYFHADSASFTDNLDNLSPLAAMERTIVQHEQQMGPPPFDATTLTGGSSSSSRSASSAAAPTSSSYSSSSSSSQATGPASHSQVAGGAPVRPNSLHHHHHHHQASPQAATAAFSPAAGLSSPAARTPVAGQGSPLASRLVASELPPQSPLTSGAAGTTMLSSSASLMGHLDTPATPSSTGGVPTQVQQQQQVLMNQQHGGPSSVPAMGSAQIHDHQPLSNGSASAGSVTSASSTMTPGGQSSLGSVGMGGDSRCATAQPTSLDDLISHQSGLNKHSLSGALINHASHPSDDKKDILMGKLMMDSHESLLRDHQRDHGPGSDLALALEEAEWKQQLDQGKSEHLANFLNEPLMSKQVSGGADKLGGYKAAADEAASRMLSGGLHPSDDDDDANHSHGSSPGADPTEFANYLEPDGGDSGVAGLPPDDSILDLFER